MERILVVLRGPIDAEVLRRRCLGRVAHAHEVAVCRVLRDGDDSLYGSLRAQQELTATLRRVLGESAERVAVLVASDRDGCRVDDCARAWGATIVDL